MTRLNIWRQIQESPTIRKIAGNIGWLFWDKILRLGSGLLVGVWVARYLGPEQYGMLNYAIALAALAGALATLGLNNIVVRDLVKSPEQSNLLLGTAFTLKLLGGFVALAGTVAATWFLRPDEGIMRTLVFAISLGLVFQAGNTIDFHFQSQTQSKYTVLAMNAAFLVSTGVKIALLWWKAPLVAFAWMVALEAVLGSLFLVIVYRRQGWSIFHWRFDKDMAIRLMQESWPLVLSGIATMINVRIDQIMLGNLSGDTSVGIYSAAVKISEIWLMIPSAVSISVFPAIVAAKGKGNAVYVHRLRSLFFAMCCFAIPAAALVATLSGMIVHILYGAQYTGAETILAIHIWSGLPFLISFAYGHVFYIEKLIRWTLISTILQPVANICLNWWLIPLHGGAGAATATLVSTFLAFTISMVILYFKSEAFGTRTKS